MPIILILMFELQSSIENIKYSKVLFDSTDFNKVSIDYGFYKARNEEIYIIEEYGNLIINYYSPEKCKFLSI